MKSHGDKNEGVNRTKYMRFYPFVSTGKERDEETGYGYFGARYMDHELMTMWLSVDPMTDKYPSMSPYNYCAWNPVKLVDPNGSDTVNFANSRFLRSQPDYSNVLIINAHGKKFPPVVKNDNIDYDNDFSVISSNSINASSLASYIRKTNVYHDNDKNNRITPLFLISCQTGESTVPYYSFADGLGQACPNSLVVAPVGDVHAKNGFFQLSPKDGEKYHCYWRILYNGEDIGRIENYQAFDIKTLVSRTQEAVNSYNAKHPDNPIQMPEINQQ